MPQRPAGAAPDRGREHVGETASTARGPALGPIVTATQAQVRGQALTVTPGFGPLPATYLPATPLSSFRGGRGGTARLGALASRVLRSIAGVRHHRASQDGCADETARRLRSIS
ncbi:hypothetical protein GCM10009608_04580 [Pseudonocardia alaniniphila]